MTIEEILAGESKNVEFKENLPEKSIKYMKSVVAFANGTGGKIIFGIADKTREVVGFDKEDVFKKIVSHCKEYGFVFPSSDIYDGLGAVYDYGQNGVELKNYSRYYAADS